MSLPSLLQGVKPFLAYELFEIAGTKITVATALMCLAIVLSTLGLSRLLRRIIKKAFALRGVQDQGTVGLVGNLVHYVVLVVGMSVALQTVGVDLGALFAAGAVFAVGLGFAMQNIAQNFVSGVILLVERTIKPGDVLVVGDHVVKVTQMGIRATTARTLDGEDLLIPNSALAQDTVMNYTVEDRRYRLRAQVGVAYASDLAQVQRVLEEVVETFEGRVESERSVVLLVGFGASSVDFEVCVWVEDPWQARPTRSRLNHAIWNALRAARIEIAFPQLDVHLDPDVRRGLAGLARAS